MGEGFFLGQVGWDTDDFYSFHSPQFLKIAQISECIKIVNRYPRRQVEML